MDFLGIKEILARLNDVIARQPGNHHLETTNPNIKNMKLAMALFGIASMFTATAFADNCKKGDKECSKDKKECSDEKKCDKEKKS